MFALIGGAWDIERWSDIPIGWVVALVVFLLIAGLLLAVSIEWDSRKERRRWAVKVSNDVVAIIDDKCRATEIPISALQLVVAMESQSVWRDDLSIALFDEGDEPLIVFPLIASGAEGFVQWLSAREGFRSAEFAAAKASAKSAAHVVWMAN